MVVVLQMDHGHVLVLVDVCDGQDMWRRWSPRGVGDK